MCNRILVSLMVVASMCCAVAEDMSLDECRTGAEKGDAEALWQLGCRYENGDGVRKDNLKAVSQYRKAAEKNHTRACKRLSELYETGKIVGKDPVKAARYRALANGESGAEAAEKMKTKLEQAKVDDIEVALDYIIGRRGKTRDAKAGIRILYKVAKDNPTAQRVFVERWEKGDLDAGLETIDAEEWQLVIPWFRRQYDAGHRKSGLILGNQARRERKWRDAVRFYCASGKAGVPRAWYLLGNFYYLSESYGGGPKDWHSDKKAKSAYEKALEIDSGDEQVRRHLAHVCLFGDEGTADYRQALEMFSAISRKDSKDLLAYYWAGLAGVCYEEDRFWKRWPRARFDYLVSQADNPRRSKADDKAFVSMKSDWDEFVARRKQYERQVRRAAERGCEEARQCIAKWDERR